MATNLQNKISWDSCVVINCLQKTPGRYEWIRPVVLDAEAGNLVVVTSTYAILETFRIDGCEVDKETEIIDAFFDSPWIYVEACGTKIARLARDLRRKFKLDGIDSIHVATAMVSASTTLLTNDGIGKKNRTPILALDDIDLIPGYDRIRIVTPEKHQQLLYAAAAPLTAPHTPSSAIPLLGASPFPIAAVVVPENLPEVSP